jgi:hypothetical protein
MPFRGRRGLFNAIAKRSLHYPHGWQERIDAPRRPERLSRTADAPPDKHDDFKLVGVYDLTGSYIPFFPFDLNGQEGIDGWFKRLEKQGFKITKLV